MAKELSPSRKVAAKALFSAFKVLKENGGTIVHQDAWGLRSLAYPIAKKTTGLYYVVEYKAPTETNAKLEIQMNRDESIMRHMVTRLDKYAEAYNLRKRNKNATVENAS